MLTCFISYQAFKLLTASARTDIHLFGSFYKVIDSKAIKTVIITPDRDKAINDAELFNLLFSLYGDRHPQIISEEEFEDMEINLFNHGRALVISGDARAKLLLIKETGVLHARMDDTNVLKTLLNNLFIIKTFKLEGKEPVFKEIPSLPVFSIYYQQPYLGSKKKDEIVTDVNRIIRGLAEYNPDIFYNSECLMTLIYTKKAKLTEQELKELNDRIKAEICTHLLTNCNINLRVDFCEGYFDAHARLLLSDYFVCTADNAFTEKNVPIDFVAYAANRNKYKLAYQEIAKSVGGEKKIRVMPP